MDAAQVTQLHQFIQTLATSMQVLQANAATGGEELTITGMGTTLTQVTTAPRDAAAAVALTGIKIPLDRRDNAEERLINFHQSLEEIDDKLTVANITNKKRHTSEMNVKTSLQA